MRVCVCVWCLCAPSAHSNRSEYPLAPFPTISWSKEMIQSQKWWRVDMQYEKHERKTIIFKASIWWMRNNERNKWNEVKQKCNCRPLTVDWLHESVAGNICMFKLNYIDWWIGVHIHNGVHSEWQIYWNIQSQCFHR